MNKIYMLGELSAGLANARHVAIFRDYFAGFIESNTFHLRRFNSNLPNKYKVCSVLLLSLILSCTPGTDNATYESLSGADKAKFDKYMILGREIYSSTCLNCHQKDGNGLHGIIPPLANSDYLKVSQPLIPCLLKKGTKDSITVNNISYPPQMPPHNLTNLELAEVITFINNSWGNEYGFVTVSNVDKLLLNCN